MKEHGLVELESVPLYDLFYFKEYKCDRCRYHIFIKTNSYNDNYFRAECYRCKFQVKYIPLHYEIKGLIPYITI